MKKEAIALLFIIFIILVSLNSYSAVFINEIMYNPSSSQGSDESNEWIEIFNDDTSPIDLTNAILCGESLIKGLINSSDGSINRNTTFILEPFSFALITDGGTGTETYSNFIVDPNALAFHVSSSSMCKYGLHNSGEVINLTMGNASHIVDYTPFLSLANGNGTTLIFYKGNFTESAFVDGTPGSNNDQFAPDFNKWLNPINNNTFISGLLNITVNITDVTNVSSALVNFNETNFSMTKHGGIWSFLWNTRLNIQKQYNITIYFNDSYGKANSDTLFNITINNTNNAPNVLFVNLTNTDFLNRTNGTLLAFWSFSDQDNDAIIANETLWYTNNTLITNYTNKTFIHPNNTTKLENWTFSVRVFDGFNWSDFFNSSIIAILNAKPSINIITNSIELSETQKANISLGAFDLDSDLLNYTINDSRFFREGSSFVWNTNLSSAGRYMINTTVNDSLDIDSLLVNITINDARDLDNDGNPDFNDADDDNDAILDEDDFLLGNLSVVNTTIPISIAINGTLNLSKLFNGTFTVNINKGAELIIEFNFTFNPSSILDLGTLTINKTTNGSSAVSIRGLSSSKLNSTKTIFLEKINTTAKAVCVKDDDASFEAITSACDSTNEILLICGNSSSGQYACFDTGLRYKITGLSHSALKEQCSDADGDRYGNGCSLGYDCDDNDASKAIECSAPGSVTLGGGNPGSIRVTCISKWICEEWSACINSFRSRECLDANECAFPTKMPAIAQECIVSKPKESITPIGQQAKSIIQKKESAAKEDLATITGQVVKEGNRKPNLGIFTVFFGVFLIAGIYLAIKNKVLSKVFK